MTPKQREAQDALLRYGTQQKAADALGISRSSLRGRLRESNEIQSPNILKHPANSILITVVGDTHDAPWQADKIRFYQIGKHVNDRKSDQIIQLGDMASFDSLNSHIDNATVGGKKKRPLYSDFLSLEAALDQMNLGLNSHRPDKHITKGNHEQRVRRFENEHPELEGILVNELNDIFSDRGWSYSDFGEMYYVDGVGFTHVPLNKMGKPYGGKTSVLQIANDAVHDIVFGNSHNNARITVPKLGGSSVTVVNAGCAMPQGHIESYAKHSLTGWWWGVMDMVIAHGRIVSVSEVSMAELDSRYGDRIAYKS